jgi:hypothetical protein
VPERWPSEPVTSSAAGPIFSTLTAKLVLLLGALCVPLDLWPPPLFTGTVLPPPDGVPPPTAGSLSSLRSPTQRPSPEMEMDVLGSSPGSDGCIMRARDALRLTAVRMADLGPAGPSTAAPLPERLMEGWALKLIPPNPNAAEVCLCRPLWAPTPETARLRAPPLLGARVKVAAGASLTWRMKLSHCSSHRARSSLQMHVQVRCQHELEHLRSREGQRSAQVQHMHKGSVSGQVASGIQSSPMGPEQSAPGLVTPPPPQQDQATSYFNPT